VIRASLPSLLLVGCLSLGAAEPVDPLGASLPWRTALHHDPSLEEPLLRLVAVWREAGREAELIDLYRTHCQAWRQDAGAWAVGARILAATGSTEIETWLDQAIAACPDDAYLQVLLAEHRARRGLEGRGEALATAVEKATDPARRRAYARLLLLHLCEAGRAEQFDQAIASFMAAGPQDDDASLRLVGELMERGRHEVAAGWLQRLAPQAAELQVERELLLARCRQRQGEAAAAAQLLDELLARLDHAYWRRGEVLRQRLALVDGPEQREALFDTLRAAVAERPGEEQTRLDLATAEQYFGRDGQALDLLREAVTALPASTALEQACIEAFQRCGDYRGLEQWLTQRLAADPRRLDLRERRVELLFTLERGEAAQRELDTLLAELDPALATERRLHLARRLARVGLDEQARALFAAVCAAKPARLDHLAEWLALVDEAERLRLLTPERLGVEAAGEHVRSLVRWLRQQSLSAEAVRLLELQLALREDDQNRHLLLRCLVDLGGLRRAGEELERLRGGIENLADYQRWLEDASLVYAGDPDFLWRELVRQRGEAGSLQRALSVCERLSQDPGQAERLLVWLEREVPIWPDDSRAQVRRIQVELLARDVAHRDDLLQALTLLADEDAERSDDLLLRRLSISFGFGGLEPDPEVLDGVVWERVRDVRSLSRVASALVQQHPEAAQPAFRRLIELEPQERRHWQGWLDALHRSDDGMAFARGVRRVLAAPELDLSPDIRRDLAESLRDALWITISRGLVWGQADNAQLRALVDEVAALRRPDDAAWLLWARLRLARLDNDPLAAAEARSGLLARCSQEEGLTLPDGSWCSMAELQHLLVGQPTVALPDAPPLPAYRLRWQTEGQAVLGRLGDLLLLQREQDLVAVERSSGKLLWQRKLADPRLQPCCGEGLVVCAGGSDSVLAYDATGTLLWRTQLGGALLGLTMTTGNRVLVVNEADELILIDGRNGRRLRRFPAPELQTDDDHGDLEEAMMTVYGGEEGRLGPLLLAAEGSRVFVGGDRPRILDLESGELHWDFSRLRRSRGQVSLHGQLAAGGGWNLRPQSSGYFYLQDWGSDESGLNSRPMLINDVVGALLNARQDPFARAELHHDRLVVTVHGSPLVLNLGMPPAAGGGGYYVQGRWIGAWRGRQLLLDAEVDFTDASQGSNISFADGGMDPLPLAAGPAIAACLSGNLLLSVHARQVLLTDLDGLVERGRWSFDEELQASFEPQTDADYGIQPLTCRIEGDLLLLCNGRRVVALEHAGE
jgi:thioredoxin-like negative regulator of GroEL